MDILRLIISPTAEPVYVRARKRSKRIHSAVAAPNLDTTSGSSQAFYLLNGVEVSQMGLPSVDSKGLRQRWPTTIC